MHKERGVGKPAADAPKSALRRQLTGRRRADRAANSYNGSNYLNRQSIAEGLCSQLARHRQAPKGGVTAATVGAGEASYNYYYYYN